MDVRRWVDFIARVGSSKSRGKGKGKGNCKYKNAQARQYSVDKTLLTEAYDEYRF